FSPQLRTRIPRCKYSRPPSTPCRFLPRRRDRVALLIVFSESGPQKGGGTNILPIGASPAILWRSRRVRDRTGRWGGSRSRSRGDRLGRGFRFRSPEEITNHGFVGVDKAAREDSLAQPEDVRFLQAPADEDLEVEPLGNG